MLQRVRAVVNVFDNRKKTNTVFQPIREFEPPENKDQDILKDEIITLSGNKSIKQNLHIKTFAGTSEIAVKSKIYKTLSTYLMLQLILKIIAKKICVF